MLVAEDDDLLFFRAQRLVRWALLSQGARLQKQGRLRQARLIFDLPWRPQPALGDPLAYPADVDLSTLAESEQQRRLRARVLVPPQRIVEGRPEWTLPDGRLLTGTGIAAGNRVVSGRALVVRSLDDPAQSLPRILAELREDTILVLPTLLPSWAPAVWGALGVVTDSGGALSHGAILARERGIPAVLGTRHATRSLTTGQPLLLDSDRGLVVFSPQK
jgi:pyruvate,water dikinase